MWTQWNILSLPLSVGLPGSIPYRCGRTWSRNRNQMIEAIGPGRHLVHEEARLIATQFIQTILEDADAGWIDSLLWQTVLPIDDSLAEEMMSYVQMAMMLNNIYIFAECLLVLLTEALIVQLIEAGITGNINWTEYVLIFPVIVLHVCVNFLCGPPP